MEKDKNEEKTTAILENTTENNAKEEVQEEKAIEDKPGLTVEESGGIEQWYQAYLRKEKVQFPPWLIETKKGVEVLPQQLFAHIKKVQPIVSVKLGNSKGIVVFTYKDGKYIRWTESDWKSFIKSFLPVEIRKPSDWERVYKELLTEYANTDENELNADENIINFQNGILDLTTGNLKPHSPEYKSTIQIPCDYKPNLPLAKATYFYNFLKTITNGNQEDMYTILEIIGLSISNVAGWRFKKMAILKGKGNTGKSVLRESIIKLVGEENTYTADISQLNSRFGASGIFGKRLVRKW